MRGVAAAMQRACWKLTCTCTRWLAIAASTVALRSVLAPLTVLQMKNTAKLTVRVRCVAKAVRELRPAMLQLARPVMERLQARMKTQVWLL